MQERTERELRLNEDGGKISLNAKLPSNKNKKKCAQQVDKSTPLLIPRHGQPFDATDTGCYDHYAGWSSLVARWAHNPKVGGSNPPPATFPTLETCPLDSSGSRLP